MAIQKINLGTAPNGVGGDTLRSTATKINENFSNATHAASRLLGTGAEQIPLNTHVLYTANTTTSENKQSASDDCNNFLSGSRCAIDASATQNSPPNIFGETYYSVDTMRHEGETNRYQIAQGLTKPVRLIRNIYGGTWSEWRLLSTNISNTNLTTWSVANVVVDAEGRFLRSNRKTIGEGDAGLNVDAVPIIASNIKPKTGFSGFIVPEAGDNSGVPSYQMILNIGWIDNSHGVQILSGLADTKSLGFRHWTNATQKWGAYQNIRTSVNTTIDGNGFLKGASPIVKVHADKVDLNDEAEQQNVTFKKNGIGDYIITTKSGLSTDGWYLELPKDLNGNPKVAVTLSEVEGVITLKSYKRIFSMETFTFEPDLDNPLDIPTDRWIDIRLNEIPVEQPEMPLEPTEGTNTPVAEAKAPSEPVEPYSEV